MIEHGSIVNTILSQIEQWNIKECKNSLQFASFSFDASVSEIFTTLLSGTSLYVLNETTRKDVKLFEAYIQLNQIEIATLPPAYLKLVNVESLKGLKVLITAGEPAICDKVTEFLKYGTFYNAYGPTEASVCGTMFRAEKGCILDNTVIPIGSPIANTTIYIIDEFGNLQAEGINGEICISGIGLARGYLNRLDLTAEKFVSDPFRAGHRMYRTGDIGRWLSDGNIEYVGRVDAQVKIRGHRIELGEIESVLSSEAGIVQSVVIIREKGEEKYIVAYYVSDSRVDKRVLQSNLRKVLPDYMLPSYYVQLDAIPLTTNGKIDVRSLPSVGEVDLIKEEYISARNESEKVLVRVWSEVLKYDTISVRDNFYNLGGDSIKSIQVVSRLKQEGYVLKVDQLLRVPVLEDLAKQLSSDTVFIDQSEVRGSVNLTPIQKYFFESSDIRHKSHYNQSVLLKSMDPLDGFILDQSISALVVHHDALRMVYKEVSGSWLQYNADSSCVHYKIVYEDLRGSSDELASLNASGELLQSGFELDSGILFHVGHYRLSDGDRLLLIIHHLVVDGVSWRILLEDLSNLYSAYQAGRSFNLPLKTDSFQRWSSGQLLYAQSEKMQEERSYWESQLKFDIPLPAKDHEVNSKDLQIDNWSTFLLDRTFTHKLQTQVHHAYSTEINDILLTGLGLALRSVFGVEQSVIRMEGHGREDILEGIDISRTVGWFTSVYPFILDISSSRGPELIAVKEDLRRIPNKGIGYGILKYLDTGFSDDLACGIQFNYLGDFGSHGGGNKEGSLFEFCSDPSGSSSSVLNGSGSTLLDISGMMVSGQLQMSIRYPGKAFDASTIDRLAKIYRSSLEDLIGMLSSIKDRQLTPSDLTYKKLRYSELQELNKDNLLEDVYELSPLQQGLYYHWLLDSSSSSYFEQTSYRLHSDNLNIELVKQSYHQLIRRYSVLRTSFTNNYGIPLQVVYKAPSSNSFFYEKPVKESRLTDPYLQLLKEKDKSVGFNFEQPTQMRLTVVDLGGGKYEFIWSHHHILMDGWCISIILNDFYRILMALSNHVSVSLDEPVKYSTYIKWLSKLNKKSSLDYWKNYLSGLESVTEIPFMNKQKQKQISSKNDEHLHIEGELFQRINQLCRDSGITQNIFIQGVWGYLLSRYNNTQDVVFGSVVSGRPGELSGVETMVGLFINTIPVRIQYTDNDTVKTFLNKLHLEALESTPHHYLNLAEVQAQSVLGMELISNLMMFENYLIQDNIGDEIKQLYNQKENEIEVESVAVFEQTNYDFGITVVPLASSLKIAFKYDTGVFDPGSIQKLVSHFEEMLHQFSEDAERLLNRIDYLTSKEKNQLLHEFNDTAAVYTYDKTITDLFEEQAGKTPEKIAVVFEETALTYKEINEQANQLARYLRENYQVKADDLVGIKLERSDKIIIVMLGILKSGAAYVPIDPTYPQERISYIEKDSNSKLIIDKKELEVFYSQQKKYAASDIQKSHTSENLAYVIYTSGSTGNPKGVMIEHKNVINFLCGMTNSLTLNENDKLLAITSISFDISVLELIWTLINGVTININGNRAIGEFDRFVSSAAKPLDFSIFYFSNVTDNEHNKYGLIKETVHYADENGYAAVWFPERHFHEFGGVFPNPSLLGAAFANSTKNIEIRSGSVVLPLHDVVRVAEEWSVVDNLSGGRMALSIASGWHPDDFIFKPENFENRHKIMYDQIIELKRIWKGEPFKRRNGANQDVELKIYPKPINPNLEIYITSAGNAETYRSAGKIGANILTHLLGQEINDLKANIIVYKNALLENGHSVKDAKISLMLHTFIGDDITAVEKIVKQPFKDYLKSSAGLIKNLQRDLDKDVLNLQDMETILDIAFERYWKTSALLGTQETCMPLLNDIYNTGVTEIACLIDFGIDQKVIAENLKNLTRLKSNFVSSKNRKEENGWTSIQITPSYLDALLEDVNSQQFIKSLKNIIVGGENFTDDLLRKIKLKADATIYNMYGPTETTIWSTYQQVSPTTRLNIGKPIQNTQVYVLDKNKLLCPVGVKGDLYIGGDGLSRGSYNQPQLTGEKFITVDLYGNKKRLYQTGDVAKWLSNQTLDFIGRNDNQVKLNGFRIELGEVERAIVGISQISQAVVVVKERENKKFMVAYYVSKSDIDKKSLQLELGRSLPEYMIPRYFLQLESIPLTPNGKINRRALPEVDEKDVIKDQYVAPSTREEIVLAAVWAEVLRQDKISIKDSFYNLGGDSIRSIGVVSLLKQKGFILKVEQILKNPVLQDLARLMESNKVIVDQSPVIGEVELTPIQQLFFENKHIPAKDHYSESIILKSSDSIDPAYLEQALSALVLHHDALRMVFKFENNTWKQHNADTTEKHYAIQIFDLKNAPDESNAFADLVKNLPVAVDIQSGILLHVAHVSMTAGDRLVITVHQLVIDRKSWEILLTDLTALYSNFKSKSSVKLPLKTDSFQRWASLNKERVKNKQILRECSYWNTNFNNSEVRPAINYRGLIKVNARKGFVLDTDLTHQLLTTTNNVYNTEITDSLLTCLAISIQSVFGVEKSVVRMQISGRDKWIEDSVVERTIGCFTGFYPLLLYVKSTDDIKQNLVRVKENVRNVPQKGMNYGILKCFTTSIAAASAPLVTFNYSSALAPELQKNILPVFEYTLEDIERHTGTENGNDAPMEITVRVVDKQLQVAIAYTTAVIPNDTVNNLTSLFEHNLKVLATALLEENIKHLTPSDLTYKKLSFDRLTSINEDSNLEDVYELSALQQGLYYHWLVDNSSPMYFAQMTYVFQVKSISIDILKQAYDQLVDRYAVLRTRFANDLADVPLQIVYRKVASGFSYEQIPVNLSINERNRYAESVKLNDRLQGFNLEKPSQIRLKVLDYGDGIYEFIWSYHHVIIDGWCLKILINDFSSIYQSIQNNRTFNLPQPKLFSSYIQWLKKLDKDVSLSYWRNYLLGYNKATEIPFKMTSSAGSGFQRKMDKLVIGKETVSNVQLLCNKIKVTQNVFMQSVWGYLLSKYNNTQDVVFGAVVSGRSANFTGIEDMVGIFINTVPVRIKYTLNETPVELLTRIQKDALDSTDHHYGNLSDIQTQSEVGIGLINHILVFQNLPVQNFSSDSLDAEHVEDEKKFTLSGFDLYRESNYDFEIALIPSSDALTLEFQYNGYLYSTSSIAAIMNQFQKLVKEFSLNPTKPLQLIDVDFISDSSQKLKDQNRLKLNRKFKKQN